VEITQPFYMGTTEVTVKQFRQFIEANPDYNVGDDRWRNPGFEQTDHHPVVWVSWQNAADFCNWLGQKEGKKYRLPTEAEWEYSCRAGKSGTRYCYGDDEEQLENYAWSAKNSGGRTQPVGKKKPNDWGLYDMHGNAWEWCQDYFGTNYYMNSPVKDPRGVGDSIDRVLRGGSLYDPPVFCRSAFRHHILPGFRNFNVGLRVLLLAPPSNARTESGAKDKLPKD
jgi:formylglycine-generating enzyme required for sulfatase activity